MLQCRNAIMQEYRRDEQPTGQSTTAFGSLIHCLWVSPLLSEGQSCTAFGSVSNCLWVTPRVSGSQSSTALGSVDHCLWVTSPLSTSQSTTAFGSYAHCLWVSSRVSAGQSSTEYKSVSGCFSAPGWRRSHTIVPLEKGSGDFGAVGLITGNLINDYRLTIDDFRIEEMKNIQYRIRNNESENEEVTTMLQCRVDRVFALKGQVISAQGNALGWKGTRTPAPWFSASNPVANEGYKSQQVRVNPLQGRVNPLQGHRYSQQVRVATLQGGPYFQQVRVATLQGSRYFQQVRVATLQGSRYFQQGTVSAVPASLSDSIFPENVKYRISNNESGRGQIPPPSGTPFNKGRLSHTIVPL